VTAPRPVRLEISGELTVQTAAERKDEFLTAVDQSSKRRARSLVVRLAEVTEVDTAGLQLLIMLDRQARLLDVHWELAEPSQAVRDVLSIAQLGPDLAPTDPGTGGARP
jgi:anti-sigma B factor antagonist